MLTLYSFMTGVLNEVVEKKNLFLFPLMQIFVRKYLYIYMHILKEKKNKYEIK